MRDWEKTPRGDRLAGPAGQSDSRRARETSRRMLGVLYDVTDRKQMEAELLELNERLEEEVQAQTEEMQVTIDRLQDEVARRVLAEGKLRKRSQMLEAFFRHTITPLAFLDRSFNFIRVNEAYAKADGKTPEYFVGRNHFMLYPGRRDAGDLRAGRADQAAVSGPCPAVRLSRRAPARAVLELAAHAAAERFAARCEVSWSSTSRTSRASRRPCRSSSSGPTSSRSSRWSCRRRRTGSGGGWPRCCTTISSRCWPPRSSTWEC